MSDAGVQRTIGQYCQSIDDGRLDDVADLFAEDGVLDVAAFGVRQEGRAAILAYYRETSEPSIKGMHCTFNHVIDVAGRTAIGSFDFVWVSFAQQPRIGLGGRYKVRFVRGHSDDWLIQEMKVEVRSDPAFISGA